MAEDEFAALDGLAQADLARRGEVRPLELIDAAIARIQRINPSINAVVATTFDAARRRADRLEQAARRDRERLDAPFFGVPYLVKDLTEQAGAPVTYGSRLFARMRARGDEALVQAAAAGGFVSLGKTNTPEFGLLPSTEPLLHGPTRNPWDLRRSAGGSSGGAAAAVAARLVPVASGGDGGGSLRIPAAACGLVGLKPTRGRCVEQVRQAPGALSVSLGLTRTVRDTAALFALMQRRDADAAFKPTKAVTGPSTRRLRIALAPRSILGDMADPPTAAALAETSRLCLDLGHAVEEAAPEAPGEEAVERFLAFWSAIPANLLKRLPLLRVVTWNFRPVGDVLEPWTLGLADWHRARPPDQVPRALRFFEEIARRYAAFFERYDVILSPVTRRATPLIGEHAPDTPFDTLMTRCVDHVSYTPIHNAIGTPAMSLPLGSDPEGAPIGLQFGAAHGGEETLLHLAYELEAARPWAARQAAHSA